MPPPPTKPDSTARPGAQPSRRPAPTPTPAKPSEPAARPPLSSQLVVRVGRPWKPGTTYVVTVRGIRNVTGTTGEVRGTLTVPERPAADSARTGADSARAGADSAAAPPE